MARSAGQFTLAQAAHVPGLLDALADDLCDNLGLHFRVQLAIL
jgi:hypothetical protein